MLLFYDFCYNWYWNYFKCWNIEKIEIEVKLEILYNYTEIVKMQNVLKYLKELESNFLKIEFKIESKV